MDVDNKSVIYLSSKLTLETLICKWLQKKLAILNYASEYFGQWTLIIFIYVSIACRYSKLWYKRH